MSKIRMIFSDIDGTLLNNQHEITNEVASAVKESQRKGAEFYLASARPPSSMAYIQEALGLDTPLVAYNGALIASVNLAANSFISHFSCPVPHKDTLGIFDFCDKELLDVVLNVYSNDDWYVKNLTDPDVRLEAEISQMTPELLDETAFHNDAFPIHKLLVIGDSEDLRSLQTYVNATFLDTTAYFSKYNYLEITNIGVSKLAALREMMEKKSVTQEEVMAIGDNFNDLPMILYAGVGVAMENAPEEVKAGSDYIAKSNQESGVAEALAIFI